MHVLVYWNRHGWLELPPGSTETSTYRGDSAALGRQPLLSVPMAWFVIVTVQACHSAELTRPKGKFEDACFRRIGIDFSI